MDVAADGSLAGIVLAGGRSSRMGAAKARLDWHGCSLLRRVCGLVSRGVDGPVLVVRAPGQALPSLPSSIEVVEDPVEGEGPLRGIATGLAALGTNTERAFVCSTDLPLLHPTYVRRLGRTAGELVLPVVDGHPQVLAAVYARHLLPIASALLADGYRRPTLLAEACDPVWLSAEHLLDPDLTAADPELLSVRGANTTEEFEVLVAHTPPQVQVERYGVLARTGDAGPVRAWTVGAAAAQVGLVFDRHLLAALNGEHMLRDPDVPLVAGDTLAFLSADAGG